MSRIQQSLAMAAQAGAQPEVTYRAVCSVTVRYRGLVALTGGVLPESRSCERCFKLRSLTAQVWKARSCALKPHWMRLSMSQLRQLRSLQCSALLKQFGLCVYLPRLIVSRVSISRSSCFGVNAKRASGVVTGGSLLVEKGMLAIAEAEKNAEERPVRSQLLESLVRPRGQGSLWYWRRGFGELAGARFELGWFLLVASELQ